MRGYVVCCLTLLVLLPKPVIFPGWKAVRIFSSPIKHILSIIIRNLMQIFSHANEKLKKKKGGALTDFKFHTSLVVLKWRCSKHGNEMVNYTKCWLVYMYGGIPPDAKCPETLKQNVVFCLKKTNTEGKCPANNLNRFLRFFPHGFTVEMWTKNVLCLEELVLLCMCAKVEKMGDDLLNNASHHKLICWNGLTGVKHQPHVHCTHEKHADTCVHSGIISDNG